ncbi:unnamed protein product, partial [Mesorhabditis belari]|uniref:Uncharacterized protein n=1 Tax=Mesorhabditis belari TaxID=2138241 RepID=A0AAF3EU63_9BILA
MQSLFRTRRIDEGFLRHSEWSRKLGAPSMIGIAWMFSIPLCVFVLTPHSLSTLSGPSTTLAIILAFIVSISTMLHLAELSCAMPKNCSPYHFAFSTIGELPAFIFGWLSLTQSATISALLCNSWGRHMNLLTGGALHQISLVKWESTQQNSTILQQFLGEHVDVAALIAITLALPILFCSLTVVGTVSVCLVIVTCLILFSCSLVAFFHADTLNWMKTSFFANGYNGFLRSASTFLCLSIGVDTLSSLLEETSHPRKKIGSMFPLLTVIISLMVFIFSTVISLAIDPQRITERSTVPELFQLANVPTARYLMTVGSVCGLSGAVFVSFLPGSRIFSQLTNDHLLPLPRDSSHRPYTSIFFYSLLVFSLLFFHHKFLIDIAIFCTILRGIFVISLTHIQHFLPEPIGFTHESAHYKKIRIVSRGSNSIAITSSFASSISEAAVLQMKVAKTETDKLQNRLERRLTESSQLIGIPKSVSQYQTIERNSRPGSISSFAAVNKGHNCIEEACSHTGSYGSGRAHLYSRIDPDIPNVSVFNAKNAHRQYFPIDPVENHLTAVRTLMLFLILSTLLALLVTTLDFIHVSSIVLFICLSTLLLLNLVIICRLQTNDHICKRQAITPYFPYSTYFTLFILCLLLSSTKFRTLFWAIIWTFSGIIIYFLYGFKNSTERYSTNCVILENTDARRAEEEEQCEQIVDGERMTSLESQNTLNIE